MSVQLFADASQKFTWPVVICVAPALTEAVSDTTLPDATEVTPDPPEVTVKVVAVTVFVWPHPSRPLAATARSIVEAIATLENSRRNKRRETGRQTAVRSTPETIMGSLLVGREDATCGITRMQQSTQSTPSCLLQRISQSMSGVLD